MGDVADMILEVVLCQGCGAYIADHAGVPRFCAYCANAPISELISTEPRLKTPPPAPNPHKRNCPICGRRVKIIGLKQHMHDRHPLKEDV